MCEFVPAYYSLIQLSRRDERANIGVVLFCPSKSILQVKTRINIDRLAAFFGESLNGVVAATSAIVYRLNHSKFQTRSQLDDWISKRGNEIILTNLRPMKTILPLNEEMEALLNAYVV